MTAGTHSYFTFFFLHVTEVLLTKYGRHHCLLMHLFLYTESIDDGY
jgi:hypothetical protein